MRLALWYIVLIKEVPMLPYTVLLIIFHRDRAMTLGFKAPFLSDHRKLDTYNIAYFVVEIKAQTLQRLQ